MSEAASEPVPGGSGAGSVVLDVGGSVGALVLFTPPELEGMEIEVAGHGGGTPEPRTHSQVRLRTTGGTRRFAAVYPRLEAGIYTVLAADGRPVTTVTVSGGGVATAWWPGTGPRG